MTGKTWTELEDLKKASLREVTFKLKDAHESARQVGDKEQRERKYLIEENNMVKAVEQNPSGHV